MDQLALHLTLLIKTSHKSTYKINPGDIYIYPSDTHHAITYREGANESKQEMVGFIHELCISQNKLKGFVRFNNQRDEYIMELDLPSDNDLIDTPPGYKYTLLNNILSFYKPISEKFSGQFEINLVESPMEQTKILQQKRGRPKKQEA